MKDKKPKFKLFTTYYDEEGYPKKVRTSKKLTEAFIAAGIRKPEHSWEQTNDSFSSGYELCNSYLFTKKEEDHDAEIFRVILNGRVFYLIGTEEGMLEDLE